jgi:hypothetical protein
MDLTLTKTCYEIFFLFIFLEMKGKSQAHHTSFLMLEANKSNSKATLGSPSISESKVRLIPTSSFNFKLIVMVKFKASLNNQ